MLKNGQKRVEREEKKVRRYAFQESNQFFTCLGGQKNSTQKLHGGGGRGYFFIFSCHITKGCSNKQKLIFLLHFFKKEKNTKLGKKMKNAKNAKTLATKFQL